MKKIVFILTGFLFASTVHAQIYLAKSCDISFFSACPIEDISALNKSSKPVMNIGTNEILVKVPITGFQFKSQLMQDHFNEDYMESDKFPFAILKGKINEKIDYSKDACNKVTVTGTMNLHGVEKPITAEGTLTTKQGQIIIDSKFKVRIKDYDIKVPSLYVKNIAEEVEISVNGTMELYAKNNTLKAEK